jgi:hypothetical protein
MPELHPSPLGRYTATCMIAGLLTLSPGCVGSHSHGPRLWVEPAGTLERTVHSPRTTLREAVQSLDTLYEASAGTPEVVMAATRDVRLGTMERALQRLLPVAGETGPPGELARELIGQLLVHHEAWEVLAGAAGEAGPLFAAFARSSGETWSFPADSVVIPLGVTPVGTPIVEVLVNGVARRFWVDTGAGLTVVSSTLAAEVGLVVDAPPGRTGTSTTRTVEAHPSIIGELRLGGITIENHPTMVLDARDLEFHDPQLTETLRIDGILGWPLLRRLDLTLDLAGGRLVLREPRLRPGGARNLFWLGYPTVAVQTEEGRELLLGLDTGAATTFLGSGFVEASGGELGGTRTRRIGGAGGFVTVEVGILREATFLVDEWRVHLNDTDVRPVSEGGVLELHGIIGSDLGALGSLHIDFLNGRFSFSPSGAGQGG